MTLCDQCDAVVIQGLLCHEWGCPNRVEEGKEDE